MRFTRRRSDRPVSARSSLGSSLEALEGRTLLTVTPNNPFFQYTASDLAVFNPITNKPVPYSVQHQLAFNHGPNQSLLSNEGKIVSGKDRAGNEWTITVHGPGYVIVTDTSPNDGILDDNIDTIQLVGTDINKTYVTGNVVTSFRVQSSSTIPFNRLIAQSGVRSVILNGFSLSQTVAPLSGPNNVNTGIFLTGGVRYLQFHDIQAPIDTSTIDVPINVVIGDPSTPLQVQPTIKLDHIFNTVFNSTLTTAPANVAQTTPTVNIIVNGQLRGLDIFSTTNSTVAAGQQFLFPTVGTTGRTSVQTLGINNLNVRGAATNLTASRSAVPFQSGFSGMQKLGTAHFHGPTDAVGIQVTGPIKSLKFDKGLGDPTGTFIGVTAGGQSIPATRYGLPADQASYAALGYVAGQVTANSIGSVKVDPANVNLQTPTNPDFVQLYRQGNTAYFVTPGTALTNSAIVSAGNIGRTKVTGDLLNSEIKSGFHYGSFSAGLEGTRAASKLGPYTQNGNSINGVTSATYRPFRHFYGTPNDTAGPGRITGNVNGALQATGGITPLTNAGAGVFARTKVGYLPPPQSPTRVHGKKVR
jgi:hypothetical protein